MFFGNKDPQIIVDCHQHYAPEQASLTLLDTAESTTLFTFIVDADGPRLEGTSKQPILHIGLRHLEDAWYACNPAFASVSAGKTSCLSEAATVCIATALNVSRNLRMTRSTGMMMMMMMMVQMIGLKATGKQDRGTIPMNVPERSIWNAAQFLFGDDSSGLALNGPDIRKRCSIYTGMRILDYPQPLAVEAVVEQGLSGSDLWTAYLLPELTSLVVLLLSLGMVGREMNIDRKFQQTHALISNQNWSAYIATLSDSDPAFLSRCT